MRARYIHEMDLLEILKDHCREEESLSLHDTIELAGRYEKFHGVEFTARKIKALYIRAAFWAAGNVLATSLEDGVWFGDEIDTAAESFGIDTMATIITL